jgi:hypothetical protein
VLPDFRLAIEGNCIALGIIWMGSMRLQSGILDAGLLVVVGAAHPLIDSELNYPALRISPMTASMSSTQGRNG